MCICIARHNCEPNVPKKCPTETNKASLEGEFRRVVSQALSVADSTENICYYYGTTARVQRIPFGEDGQKRRVLAEMVRYYDFCQDGFRGAIVVFAETGRFTRFSRWIGFVHVPDANEPPVEWWWRGKGWKKTPFPVTTGRRVDGPAPTIYSGLVEQFTTLGRDGVINNQTNARSSRLSSTFFGPWRFFPYHRQHPVRVIPPATTPIRPSHRLRNKVTFQPCGSPLVAAG